MWGWGPIFFCAQGYLDIYIMCGPVPNYQLKNECAIELLKFKSHLCLLWQDQTKWFLGLPWPFPIRVLESGAGMDSQSMWVLTLGVAGA